MEICRWYLISRFRFFIHHQSMQKSRRISTSSFDGEVESHVKIIYRLDFKTTRENEITISFFSEVFFHLNEYVYVRTWACCQWWWWCWQWWCFVVFFLSLHSSFLRLLLFIFHAYYFSSLRALAFVHHTASLIEVRKYIYIYVCKREREWATAIFFLPLETTWIDGEIDAFFFALISSVSWKS